MMARIRGFLRRIHSGIVDRLREIRRHRFQPGVIRHRTLFDRVPVGLYRSDPDGRILDANSALVRMLGYPDRESLMRVNAFDLFVDPRERWAWRDRIQGEGVARGFEMRLRRRDGAAIRVIDDARIVRDRHGRVLYYDGALQDITQRRNVEAELRSANETLGTLIAASPLPILTLDRERRVTIWNEAAERTFGWRRGEVIGRRLPFVPDDKWPEFEVLSERVLSGETISDIEVVRHRRDGSKAHLSISAAPLHDDHGTIQGIMSIITDVTERRAAEEHRRRLAEILEATPDFVGIATPDGRPVYANPAGLRMLGATRQDEEDMNLWDFFPREWGQRLRQEAIPTAMREGTWSGEMVFRGPNGREIPVSQVMIAHHGDDGEIALLSTIARDISQEKMLQEKLRHSQKMDAVGQLAGGIAHDFNNLLTAIIGHCELILREQSEPSLVSDVEEIRRTAGLGAALTRQLLMFGRPRPPELGRFDLNALVSEMSDALEGVLGPEIRVETRLAAGLPEIEADRSQIEQVLLNLALNARDAMSEEGGRLTLETEPADERGGPSADPGHVVLRVRDTGAGMDEETRRRAFEPFFTRKERGGDRGLGLGLATVYGIVRQSGGQVTLDSMPGSGTVVTVRLPCAPREAEASSDATGAEPAGAATSAASGGAAGTHSADRGARTGDAGAAPRGCGGDRPTILVVEDEAAVRRVATRLLKQEGFRVLEAESGDQALRLLREDPDRAELLLTDVVMPGMRGTELAKRLRESIPRLRVIFMSGYTEGEVLGKALESDTLFLEKPFSPRELMHAIETAMGGWECRISNIEYPMST